MSTEPNWYDVESVKLWTEAKELGFGVLHAEWLTKHLNLAFHKGQQVGNERLKEALHLLCMDMHSVSSRPCDTCRFVSNVLGEPFGCEMRRKQRAD